MALASSLVLAPSSRCPMVRNVRPDGAWISKTGWNRLSEEEKDSITYIVPEFVIELRSKTDRIVKIKEKMQEYLDSGVRLGWLLDLIRNRALIYRPGQAPQQIDNARPCPIRKATISSRM